jgi:N-acetylneuraminic acid mutarotase
MDSLIMFGGSGKEGSLNDLYKFDLKQERWSQLNPSGDIPSPREGHIARLVDGDKMMIHGGVDDSEIAFRDTYVLAGINCLLHSSV